MKELDREHHIYMLEPGATPAINIDSGEELMVETWDAFEGVRDPGVIGEALCGLKTQVESQPTVSILPQRPRSRAAASSIKRIINFAMYFSA